MIYDSEHRYDELKYEWPEGIWAYLTPINVIEMWSAPEFTGVGTPGNFVAGTTKVKGTAGNLRAQKIVEFGENVGIWRLMEILEDAGVPGTLIASGKAIETHPDVARKFVELGGEIVGHSYAQDFRVHDYLDPEEERANIRRCVDVITEATGQRPLGWISPGANPSENTIRLLAEEGFLWTGDLADDELPYVVETGENRLVILPYSGSAGVNDLEIHLMQGQPPQVMVDDLRHTFEGLRGEYDRTGRPAVIRISVHAHIYGRPWGRHAFRDAIALAQSIPGVKFATRSEVAARVLASHEAPTG